MPSGASFIMSTIRKAYMEISNGIRGLRFHRDQTPPGTGNQSDSSTSKGSSDEQRSPPVSSRSSRNAVHTEEGPLTCAMSRFLPAKSNTQTSSSLHSRVSDSKFTSNTNHSSSSVSSSSSSSTHTSTFSSSSSHSSSNKFTNSSLSSSRHVQNSSDSTNSLPNGKPALDVPPCLNGTKGRRTSKDSIFNQTKLVGSPKAGIACRIRKLNLSMTGQKWSKPETIDELMMDDSFLASFFFYFSTDERRRLCQVCKKWKSILYKSVYWVDVMPVINFKNWSSDFTNRKICYENLQNRGFDHICFVGASDRDIADFVNNLPAGKKNIRSVTIRCSNVSDGGLENLIRRLPFMSKLQLSNCNEVTGSGLWACLNPKITHLTIADCIHIADDTIGAIAQLLPALQELNLQAYHVTDNGLALFDSKLNSSLRVLRLKSCWEITNHGVVNIIHSLPNVTVLSLAGCSKITDDGIEIIAENMKKLRSFDISWCSRVTDASLEYVACDLSNLEELVLDRCCHITDIGIGYISTMTSLLHLFIRWCTQVGDFGLHHIFSMRNLRVLSIAGCRRLTSNGLYGLRHLQRLDELEMTNCPGATTAVCRYLKDNMPHTAIIE